MPGETAFTRTPLPAHSIASDFVAAFSAPFVRDASTAGTLVIGWSTKLVVIVTIWPAPTFQHRVDRTLSHVEETGHVGTNLRGIVVV